MPISPEFRSKASPIIGLLILATIIYAVIASTIANNRVHEQALEARQIAACQTNVNHTLVVALRERDKLGNRTNDNLESLIKILTAKPNPKETTKQRTDRAYNELTRYFKEVKDIADIRNAIAIPDPADFVRCSD